MAAGLQQRSEVRAESAGMASYARAAGSAKRGLILRDSLTLLILSSVTIALFGITLFLFKSFQGHRADLGRRWSERGRAALEGGHPETAADALRIALSYDPDNRADQLMLAQALANAGHRDAAESYFLSLWDSQPGDGFVNLQLARLARERGDAQQAITYYRASIFGNWEGDGVARRRDVRLELADYLAQRGEAPAARAELLIAAGNAPEKDQPLQIQIADRLQDLGDVNDALHFYEVAVAAEPHNVTALEKAGRAAFAMGSYAEAYRLLSEAAEAARRTPGRQSEAATLMAAAEQARRAPELTLSRDLPPNERAAHIVTAAEVVQRRLKSCTAELAQKNAASSDSTGAGADPPVLAALKARWTTERGSLKRPVLERDAILQDSLAQLINDTEAQTAQFCGAPKGDDALLQMLASRARGGAQ